MKRIMGLAFLFIGGFFLSCSSGSFDQQLEISARSTGFNFKVDSIVTVTMNRYDIPGLAVGIVKNDSLLYARGYGVKRLGSTETVSRQSVFHTASISKIFTAQAIIHLVEEDLLTFDDKITDLLTELDYEDQKVEEITVRQLLNHTSGLPDVRSYNWENNHQDQNALGEYVEGIKLHLISEPSSAYHYSNLGYNILGYIIEKVSGQIFEDYLKQHILNPARMFDSDFRYFNIADSLKTYPHSKSTLLGNIYTREVYPYTREHAPGSTLNASANDLAQWMIYFMKKVDDSTSTDSYRDMLKPSFDAYPAIGLGFQLYDMDTFKAVGHFGGDKGFRGFLIMIPDEKAGVVVLGNCDYDEDYRQEIANPIANLLLNLNAGNENQ